jgi:hypothetical protein
VGIGHALDQFGHKGGKHALHIEDDDEDEYDAAPRSGIEITDY